MAYSDRPKRPYNERNLEPLPLARGPLTYDSLGRPRQRHGVHSLADIRAACADEPPPSDPLAREVKGPCWRWTRSLNHYGYPIFMHLRVQRFAHREAYASMFGKIAPGLVCDHLCRNPACCNPEHIELVTRGENVARGARWAHKRAA